MSTWPQMWSPFPNLTELMQNISPYTNWFSPTVEYNFAGNRAVEADVVSNVASYGRQLGALTKAVLEVSKDSKGPAVKRLRELAAQIESRKKDHATGLEDELQRKLDELKKSDPETLRRLIARYE